MGKMKSFPGSSGDTEPRFKARSPKLQPTPPREETGAIQSPQCQPSLPCPLGRFCVPPPPGGGHTPMLLTLPRLLPAPLFGVVEQTLLKVLPGLVSVGTMGQACPTPSAVPLLPQF